MRILAPLRHPPLAKLWAGQLLSAMGDEISRVAVVWLAAGLWGTGAGRLMALHAGCAFLFSVVGGAFADRAGYRRTLIVSDLMRAVGVLLIPVGTALGLPLPWLLVASVTICSSLSAIFDPAFKALAATLIPSAELRSATNALVESTVRLARVLGPSLVALVSGILPTLHFFTLDAGTFLLSATSIAWLGAAAEPAHLADGPAEGITPVLERIRSEPLVAYMLLSSAVVGAAWWLLLPLGIELLLQERLSSDLATLGTILAAYGVGNLTGNLVVGSLPEQRPERLLFLGRSLAGAGFLLFALAPGKLGFMAAAALAASGGPVCDVGYIGALQARFEGKALGQAYRLSNALCYGLMFPLFFASPSLFLHLGVGQVFVGCALVILAGGLGGFALLRAEPAVGDPAA